MKSKGNSHSKLVSLLPLSFFKFVMCHYIFFLEPDLNFTLIFFWWKNPFLDDFYTLYLFLLGVIFQEDIMISCSDKVDLSPIISICILFLNLVCIFFLSFPEVCHFLYKSFLENASSSVPFKEFSRYLYYIFLFPHRVKFSWNTFFIFSSLLRTETNI